MSHIDALDGAIRPETAPITATLDEEDETSEAFESVSSVAPVNFVVESTADFIGTLDLELYSAGAWHVWQNIAARITGQGLHLFTPCCLVPEGYQVRAVLSAVSAGSVDVTIFQGRVV